ncbi:monofunctional biosynthetic peptidoglycan transglycosylase [Pseudomonas asuensis]|uniref:Biosynthetic peptidoglycan transglycosylase n=1 Tax=Pseudomonas asuensis TaxID=1825787 RepID=A0ABQ2GNI3_9PSED|nr:monofunctional biosynthetic peptidoglycan transglycosylase [Pseudomonas asuensis]GGM03936.1 monofunctional biosynthetic peptidoglycan transglycosylase [Pseudomonas asuensis]
MVRSLLRRLFLYTLILVAVSVLLVLMFRWVPPPGSMVMVERKVESWMDGKPIDLQREWRPWNELPDNLKMSVVAGEDQHFGQHWGFDMEAIRKAFSHNEAGGSLRGASTISQQTAKNLFLWTGRSWVRKGFEAWFTLLIETLWPKQRILEVYLNSVEWGSGVFGAEAAAQYHFGIGAPYLSDRQASLLAATLPNPRGWSPSHPSAYVSRRANWIRQQVRQLGGSDYLLHMR